MNEGDNWLRILTEPVKKVQRWGHGICFDGAPYCTQESMDKEYQQKVEEAKKAGQDPKKVNRPSLTTKWAVWAIDRKNYEGDQELVIVDLSNGVAEYIRGLMDGKDSGFEAFPMPYDINVIAKGAGTKAVKYSTQAARKDSDLTEDELEELNKKTPIDQILERQQEKQREKFENGGLPDDAPTADYPEGPDAESIPF